MVLAHRGGQDGRRRYLSEATALAADDALVILPATRIRQDEGVDVFASDVRHAVLTERAALAALLESGAAPNALVFLGHSAGGALGAILRAVEPRLSRIVIFGNGAGPLPNRLSRTGSAPGTASPKTSWQPRTGSTRHGSSASIGGRRFSFNTVAPTTSPRSKQAGPCSTLPHSPNSGPNTTAATSWTLIPEPGQAELPSSQSNDTPSEAHRLPPITASPGNTECRPRPTITADFPRLPQVRISRRPFPVATPNQGAA